MTGPWCGALACREDSLTLVGGCGKPVVGEARTRRWHKGEDAVVYHPECVPTEAPEPREASCR
jgi:hypothetical protein